MGGNEIHVSKKMVWILHGMTQEKLESYKIGDKIDSPSKEILIGDNITEWCLRLFPGGKNEDTRAHIGLFLRLTDANSTDFNVKYSLGVVGREIMYAEAENTGEAFKGGWGYHKLMERKELYEPNKEFLNDDKLMLFCKLKITATEVPEGDKSASFSQELLSHYKKILMDGDSDFADFRFKTADGKVLKGHKVVLSISKFFAHLFTATKDDVLKVSEDALIMKEILRFIYYHEVQNLKENAHELVFAAEKYGLNKLKKMCINSMIESLTIENVLQTLLTADRLAKANLLKQKCFDVIASNDKQVSDEWESLPPRILVEIIRHIKVTDKDTIYL